MAFKRSSSKVKPAMEHKEKQEHEVLDPLLEEMPPVKKKRGKEIAVIAFSVFIAISMMLPSLSAIFANHSNKQQQLTPANVDKMMEEQAVKKEDTLKKDPKDTKAMNELGLLYMQWGNTIQAIGQSDQDKAHAHELFEKAEQAYQKSFDINQNADAKIGMAMVVFAEGDSQKAISELKKYAEEHDKNALVWSRLGSMYELANEKENAIRAYKLAIKLDPDNKQDAKEFSEARLKGLEKSAENADKKNDNDSSNKDGK